MLSFVFVEDLGISEYLKDKIKAIHPILLALIRFLVVQRQKFDTS